MQDIGNWSRDRAAVGGVYVDYLFDPVLKTMRDNILVTKNYHEYTHIVLGAVRPFSRNRFSLPSLGIDCRSLVVLSSFLSPSLVEPRLTNYDAQTQWLMHQPQREYEAHITNVLRIINLFVTGHPYNATGGAYPPPTPPRYIWHNSPAWPHRDDEKVHVENDTRTTARMRQMNDFAATAFMKNGHNVIETLDLSLPFCQYRESADLSHFFNSGVLDAIYRITAHRLGLCDP